MDRRDHSNRDRVLVAERASHRRDGVAGLHLRRVTERNRRQLVGAGLDAQQGNVVVDVPADDLRADPVAVLEADEGVVGRARRRRVARVRDHVGAREDVAPRRDDEARALRGVLDGIVEEGEDGHDSRRAGRVDASRLEPVPEQRPHVGGSGLVAASAQVEGAAGEIDGRRLTGRDPGRFRGQERDRRPENGRGKRDDGDCRVFAHEPNCSRGLSSQRRPVSCLV